jgi:hypothetical protein
LSKIIDVKPCNDNSILIEFEHGNKILFNMERLIKTMPYQRLKDPDIFKTVKFDERAVFWDEEENEKIRLFPLRLSLDNILFTLRD